MKMTLTFDEETAAIAKNIARLEGSSVSALVRTFFRLRASADEIKPSSLNPRLESLVNEGVKIKNKFPKISDRELIAQSRHEKYG